MVQGYRGRRVRVRNGWGKMQEGRHADSLALSLVLSHMHVCMYVSCTLSPVGDGSTALVLLVLVRVRLHPQHGEVAHTGRDLVLSQGQVQALSAQLHAPLYGEQVCVWGG